MHLGRRLRNAILLLLTGTVLSLGLCGCEKKAETTADKPAEAKKTTTSEHPDATPPAKDAAAKKKPKDHPAH